MTDTVKDALNGPQEGIDIPLPGTPKSTTSQDNGQGLGEALNFIENTPTSSRRASGEEGPKKPPSQSGSFKMHSLEDEYEESGYTSGATVIRAKTAEALKRLHQEHDLGGTCSLCDEDPGIFLLT